MGSMIGSFLNVVILRGIKGEDIVSQRSHCPLCKKQLRWFELVPVVSYILQAGRCRSCQKPISRQYPIIELLTGFAGLWLLSGGDVTIGLVLFVAVSVLLVLAVIDMYTMLLPDKFILLLLIPALLVAYLKQPVYPLISTLTAVAATTGFLGLIWLITRGRGIGLGDVKLMVPVGLLLGIAGSVTMLFVAFIAGGAYGTYLLGAKKATPKTAVPFGPFLAGATIICLLFPQVTTIFITFLGWPIS